MTPADQEAAELLRPATAPVIVAANKADNERPRARRRRVLRARLGGDLPDLGVARPGHRRPARRDRLGAAARDAGASSPERPARTRPTTWARDVAAGRLEPFVVGEEEADEDGRRRRGGRRDRPSRRPLGRRDRRRRRGRRARRDRLRRPAERRQVVAPQRAPRRGPGDRLARCPARPATRSTRRWSGAGARSSSSTPPGSGGAARSPAVRPRSAISTLRVAEGDRPRRRRGPRHRRRRGPDRPGRPRRGLRHRGGRGPRRRGQQVGPRRGQDRPDLRPVRRVDPERGAVPRLRPGRLDQREDRPARRARCWSSRSTSGASAASASPTGELNRVLRAATERQQPPVVKGRRPKIFYGTQAADRAADVRVLRERRVGSVHFSYRRYLENRLRDDVRLPRHADQADLPRPRLGQAAPPAPPGEVPRRRRVAGPRRRRAPNEALRSHVATDGLTRDHPSSSMLAMVPSRE